MRDILANALHIFVIAMMAVFIIGVILAATGSFDHWTERFMLKRRRRRLLRGRLKNRNDDADEEGNSISKTLPYASSNPEKTTITYKGSYNYHRSHAA